MNEKSIQRSLIWLFIAVTLLGSWCVHRLAGFTLPVPWNDEPWALWKSLAFMQHNTLFTEQLNPERTIYTFPGYEFVMGILFKVTGFSFPLARDVSWLCMAGGYLALVALLVRLPMPVLGVGLSSWFFFSGNFVVAANTARPDAMIFAMIMASFVLLQHDRPWQAGTLLALTFPVHPNGIYVLGPVGLWYLIRYRFRIPRPGKTDLLCLLAGALLLGLFASFWLHNKEAITADFKAAADFKYGQNSLSALASSVHFYWALAPLALLFVTRWLGIDADLLLLAGFSSQVIYLLGHEMWYAVFNGFSFLVLFVSLVIIAPPLARKIFPRVPEKIGRLTALPVFACISLFLMKHDFVPGPKNYTKDLEWGWGMRAEIEAPYLQPSDVETISAIVRKKIDSSGHSRVTFLPEGDGLLFYDSLGKDCLIYHPIRTSVQPDLLVFRESRYFADWWNKKYIQPRFATFGVTSNDLVYARDGTEKWYVKEWRGAIE